MPKLATVDQCTGCMLCVDVCPHDAVVPQYKNGFYYPSINYTKCVECKLCEKKCPVLKKVFIKNEYLDKPFAVWSKVPLRRIGSSSGGFFTELAYYCFEQASVRNMPCCIVGVIIQGKSVEHRIIEKKEDISLLQGTKYLQSESSCIYEQTLQFLRKGYLVLFSGLPCQVDAMQLFLDKKQYSGEILTCDVICNGVPDGRLLELDIGNNFPDLKQIISFRDKLKGWNKCLAFTYERENGSICRLPIEQSFFLKAFKANYALRKCCYKCSYSTIKRNTDFTIGDYWGNTYSVEEQFKGVSLVISHNVRATEILKKNQTLFFYPVLWEECLRGNPRLYSGKRIIQYAIPRFIINRLLNQRRYSILKRLLTDETGAVSEKRYWWIPFKIWTILLKHIESKYREYKLKKILNTYKNEKY